MTTPMTLPDCCAICFEPYGDGTFDVAGPYELVRCNVCVQCRLTEATMMILNWCGQDE